MGKEEERERERERGRERERERKNINWLPSIRTATHNLGMCPDSAWESDPQHFAIWDNAPTN